MNFKIPNINDIKDIKGYEIDSLDLKLDIIRWNILLALSKLNENSKEVNIIIYNAYVVPVGKVDPFNRKLNETRESLQRIENLNPCIPIIEQELKTLGYKFEWNFNPLEGTTHFGGYCIGLILRW
jgi:hypothetical protein